MKKMYLCKLVAWKGEWIKETFYREGESRAQIKEDLECFAWDDKGCYWVISEVDGDEEDED